MNAELVFFLVSMGVILVFVWLWKVTAKPKISLQYKNISALEIDHPTVANELKHLLFSLAANLRHSRSEHILSGKMIDPTSAEFLEVDSDFRGLLRNVESTVTEIFGSGLLEEPPYIVTFTDFLIELVELSANDYAEFGLLSEPLKDIADFANSFFRNENTQMVIRGVFHKVGGARDGAW